jgi:glycosyltransferase involved in cell wall biosynthesis
MRRVAAMVIGCLLHLILRDELVFALAGVPTYSRRQHVVVSTVLSAGDIAMLAGRSFELHQPPRLLYVGRLTGGKGLEYLLEAVALLIARGQDVRCSLVGDGPLKERLQELTLKNGIEDRVSFDGYIPWGSELLAAYTRADVFVFPSLSEGQGKVLLEAQAAGLAIVASRAGGIPYIIRDGENGLLVPPGDSATLAEAIARLLSDHGLRRRCVEAGLVEVCDHTVERETHDMVEIVRQTYALA